MARAVSIPSEFDLELESERIRWLRRRFLWLCAVGIVVTIGFDVHDIVHDLSSARRQDAGFLEAFECAASVLLYAVAGIYALVARTRPAGLGRLAILLVVIVGLTEMGFERIRVERIVIPHGEVGISSAGIALVVLFINFFFACLFMPWTFRESLQPASILLAAYAAVLLLDVCRGRLPPGGLFAILVLAISFMPGSAICWWRFSRFRKTFRLRFESSRYRMLQNELRAARQLHESCLPPQIDQGPVRMSYAYEPTRQIGGDLLFVHRPPGRDTLLNLVVLDVTGHGIRAALTVNRMLGELERLFAERPDAGPDEILRGLNRYVALTMRRHTLFATAFVARVDADAGELAWAGGGHPPAFLRRAGNGQQLQALESTATILGVLDGDQFEIASYSTALAPGDVLIAYTDGVCEACNRTGAQLGTQGTQRMIHRAFDASVDPANSPGEILRAVLDYRRTPVEDDTLIVAVFIGPGT